jgi:hypothetical protein
MTKSERIFQDTFFEAKKSIRDWGARYNPNGRIVGFNRLMTNDGDFMCTRTLNAITKLLAQKRKQIQWQEEVGYKDEISKLALDKVEVTIENERKILEEIKKF